MTNAIAQLPRLPQHPSTLIKLACDDAEKIYHTPNACCVCFAGAVMANTLGVDWNATKSPEHFSAPDKRALLALNLFRVGGWAEGMHELLNRRLTDGEVLELRRAGLPERHEIPHPPPRHQGRHLHPRHAQGCARTRKHWVVIAMRFKEITSLAGLGLAILSAVVVVLAAALLPLACMLRYLGAI